MPANHLRRLVLIMLLAVLPVLPAWCQGYTVSFRVEVQPARTAGVVAGHDAMRMGHSKDGSPVVAWLTPVGSEGLIAPRTNASAHSFVLAQKDKQFLPHLLVVPTGAAVEFPNLDPFFHNVFSLFNGRRFDLGLYEAGQRRTVRFDHEGVSYIFCNIHPEMGAVIISLNTSYYATSAKDGSVTLTNVPPGAYQLHFWAEDIATADLSAAAQMVHVSSQDMHLSTMTFHESMPPLKRHLNKFGEEYKKLDQTPY
jgi:plastocyanin